MWGLALQSRTFDCSWVCSAAPIANNQSAAMPAIIATVSESVSVSVAVIVAVAVAVAIAVAEGIAANHVFASDLSCAAT